MRVKIYAGIKEIQYFNQESYKLKFKLIAYKKIM